MAKLEKLNRAWIAEDEPNKSRQVRTLSCRRLFRPKCHLISQLGLWEKRPTFWWEAWAIESFQSENSPWGLEHQTRLILQAFHGLINTVLNKENDITDVMLNYLINNHSNRHPLPTLDFSSTVRVTEKSMKAIMAITMFCVKVYQCNHLSNPGIEITSKFLRFVLPLNPSTRRGRNIRLICI